MPATDVFEISVFAVALIEDLGQSLGFEGKASTARSLQKFTAEAGLQDTTQSFDSRLVAALNTSPEDSIAAENPWQEVLKLLSLALYSQNSLLVLKATQLCLSHELQAAHMQKDKRKEIWKLLDNLHSACWFALTPP
jgi:hypothetical protein